MNTRHAMAALTLGALLSACSGDGTTTLGAVARDTLPNGTVIVRYGELPQGDVRVAEVDLQLGEMDGDPNFVFGDVRGVEAGRDGTIYVLDYQASEIKAYDAQGGFLRTVVSRGKGPAEITEANGMVLLGDSILWIQDHSQWMMIGVSTEGVERRRFPMHVLSYGYLWNGTVDRRERVWKYRAHSNDEDSRQPPEEGLLESPAREYMVFFDPHAEVTDSIYVGETTYRSMVSRTGGGYSYRTIPNHATSITVVDPGGGMWRTPADAYRVVRLDERGDTVLVIESATPALPVTAADRADYIDGMVERDPSQRRVAQEIADLMPETKPIISRLIVDDEGRLWVGRAGAIDARPQYDIFARDGTYEGTVELAFQPSTYGPMRIRYGNLYTVVRDALDVPFVVRAGVATTR